MTRADVHVYLPSQDTKKIAAPETSGNVDMKSSARNPDKSWNCQQCTFLNTPEAKRCATCDARAPALPNRAPRRISKPSSSATPPKHGVAETSQHCAERRRDALLRLLPPSVTKEEDDFKATMVAGREIPVLWEVEETDEPREEPPSSSDEPCAGQDVTEGISQDSHMASPGTSTNFGKRRAASKPWACATCSFENPWLSVTCGMCLSPRLSMRTENYSLKDASPAMSRRRKREAHLQQQQRLEEKRRAALKTLARVAAESVRGGASDPFGDSEMSRIMVPRVKKRKIPTGNPRGRPKGSKNHKEPARPSSGDHAGDDLAAPDSDGYLCQGTLIRYRLSQQETSEARWCVGMVQAAWQKSPWYMVTFDNGKKMWVRLDPAARGEAWEDIKGGCAAAATETARFERKLAASNLAALGVLRSELKASISSRKSPFDTTRSTIDKAAAASERLNHGVRTRAGR